MRSIMKKATTGAGLAAAILGTLALAASLSACNNNYPIYGSIQLEQPGSTNGPFYKTTVGMVLAFNGKYYAQRATIASSSDGTNWSMVSMGNLGSNYFCTGLAATTTELWAVVDGVGLYKSGDGATWTQVLPDPTSNQTGSPMIDNVFTANNVVFIEYHNENGTTTTTLDDTWKLTIPNGVNPTTLTVPSGSNSNSASIRAIAYADGSYWAATDIGLYASTTADAVFTLDNSGPTGKIDSLLAVGTTLYVGTDAGAVYKRTTGGTWSNVSSLTYAVTALAEVPVPTSVYPGGFALLAGYGANSSTVSSTSVGYGYVQLDPVSLTVISGGSSAVASNATNYDTTLSGKPIEAFLYTGTRLFAATASAGISGASGLWLTTWDGSTSTWGGWSPIN